MTDKLPVPPNLTRDIDGLSFFNILAERAGSVDENNALVPATLADSEARNGTIYYSSTQSKLVFKDNFGVVNDLY